MSLAQSTQDAGGPLHRTCSGSGDRLVLVHGFTQSGASMRHLARRFAPRRQACCVDLPFHGASPGAADLSEAARLLGESCGRADYLGYSLGGRCCLTLALERPSLVRRLVLVGASAGITDEAARAERRRDDEVLAARLEEVGLGVFLEEWLAGPLFAHLGAVAADLGARSCNSVEGLAGALRHLGVGTQQASLDLLHTLEMPVLLLTGEHDAKFGAIAEEMADAIGANATALKVPGAGHAAPFESPDALADLVGAFLATA